MNTQNRKTVGLALGSGSARGISHIGVIKALEENNIPIDYIAGSSIGSLVGGIYVTTMDTKYMENIVSIAGWRQNLSLVDPTLTNGFIKGDKLKKFMESHVNHSTFEQLQIPLTVMTTDLQTGKAVAITEGLLAPAIRASVSFPLVFQPVEHQGKFLVDGGLATPVPVSAVKEMGADIVIAVDLDAKVLNLVTEKNSVEKLGLYGTTKRSFDIMRHHLAKTEVEKADIVIAPRVDNTLWYEFVGNEGLIKSGEDAVHEQIEQIKKLLGDQEPA